jgi:hypothetical protein
MEDHMWQQQLDVQYYKLERELRVLNKRSDC